MALTYSPFAEVPEVNDLRKDLTMNVGDTERIASGLAGGGLVALGLAQKGIARWALLLAGGALIQRGMTGHCALYERLELDKRHVTRGVPGNRGVRVEEAVEIQRPADVLYQFWGNLEQLPKIMRHVESVQQIGGKRSHWKVKGPVGISVEWDAEIINDQENELIAWQSLPGATVANAGSVRFEPIGGGATRLKVAFELDPPAGSVGVAVAELVGRSPGRDLAEDLTRFKEFAERELLPLAGA